MDEKQLKEIDVRLKKLENVFYGLSDDTRVKEVIRKNIIVDYDSDNNPIVIDKFGAKFTLSVIGGGGGFISLGANTELTIAAGVITPTGSYHTVDTESDAASDDLTDITVTGLSDGTLLLLMAADSGRTVNLIDGGNLRLAGNFALDHSRDTILLIKGGSVWYEVSRSDNDS